MEIREGSSSEGGPWQGWHSGVRTESSERGNDEGGYPDGAQEHGKHDHYMRDQGPKTHREAGSRIQHNQLL
jgi:hypothetical protein